MRPDRSASRPALSPAGPEPTIATSTTSEDASGSVSAVTVRRICSTAILPSFTAFLMSPRPPSSPTMYSPGMFVSKFVSTCGTTTRFTAAPAAIAIAPTGQAVAHSPCPTQCAASTEASLPRIVIASGSGHAATHVPQPTHISERTCARIGSAAAPAAGTFAIAAVTTSNTCTGALHFGHTSAPAGTVASQRGQGRARAGAAVRGPLPFAGVRTWK